MGHTLDYTQVMSSIIYWIKFTLLDMFYRILHEMVSAFIFSHMFSICPQNLHL